MIFGKHGCSENRNWGVTIFFTEQGDYQRIIDQVNEQEATKVFEELKKEMETNKKTIVIDRKHFQSKKVCINKDHIQEIVLTEN